MIKCRNVGCNNETTESDLDGFIYPCYECCKNPLIDDTQKSNSKEKKLIALLAGSRGQANQFIEEYPNLEYQYYYVECSYDVKDRVFCGYTVIGSFWQRTDSNKLYNLVRDYTYREIIPIKKNTSKIKKYLITVEEID